MSVSTDPRALELFNCAAQLADKGLHKPALEAWNDLLTCNLSMTVRFRGIALLRKAWTLIDMQRRKEARRLFENDQMQESLSELTLLELYDYYMAYGDVLGSLGHIDEMDHLLSRALGLAVHDLEDLDKAKATWLSLLNHAARARDWTFVLKESERAGLFARRQGRRDLSFRVRWYKAQALRGLGRFNEARREGASLLASAHRAGEQHAIDALQTFLDTIDGLADRLPNGDPHQRSRPGSGA